MWWKNHIQFGTVLVSNLTGTFWNDFHLRPIVLSTLIYLNIYIFRWKSWHNFMQFYQGLLIVWFNYRPQRSSGKVIFSQPCVILFTGGVGIPACTEADPPRADTPPGTRPPPGADTPPNGPDTPREQSILRDTVNARAVRILLECNLVKRARFGYVIDWCRIVMKRLLLWYGEFLSIYPLLRLS